MTDFQVYGFEYDKKRKSKFRWDVKKLLVERWKQKVALNKSFLRVFLPEFNLSQQFFREVKYRTSGERNLIIEIIGETGCLSVDTRIKGHRGAFKIISKRIIRTKSYDFKLGKIVDSVSFMIPSGRKELFEVKTSGSVLKASADHKFFVFQNGVVVEKKLGDLKVGDKLVRFKR